MKLANMSRKELEALRAEVDEAIVQAHKQEKQDALAAAQKAAAEYGFSLEELTAKRGGKPGGKSGGEAKFINPENPTQTWTGKGRQPNWYKAAIDAGKSADDLAI